MAIRRSLPIATLLLFLLTAMPQVQPPRATAPPRKESDPGSADWDLVEKVIASRNQYQKSLEELRAHYMSVNDLEHARWAEEELRQYHRIPKQAFRLELVVPPETLRGDTHTPEAHKLFIRAMEFKGKGTGIEFVDNQRRAELLFQQLLTRYPASDRISDTAYQLGDIYENKPYKQFRLAAVYFERCVQWNPMTNLDARLRAARLYDRQKLDHTKALGLYREILQRETDAKRREEANKRLQDLNGGR